MLKPYEEYKKSKSPFHRNIPSHWTEKRLAAVCSIKCVQNNEGEELLSVFLNRGVINYKDTHQKQVHKPSEDMSKYQLVEPGDLVLNNQQAWRGSVGVSKYRGIVSPAYYVYSINDDINPFFLNYMVRDRDVVDQFVLASKGVGSIQRMLNNSYLKNVIFTIPPREEQDQIVRFLDWKLAKTNKLIRAKKKQIALLNEQRKVIINDAVTKGLDPNVPMKNSGIEWINTIPISWKKDKVSRLFNIIGSGTTPSSGNSIYYENATIPWINSGDLYPETMYLSKTDRAISQRAINDYSVLKIYPKNTLVIAMYGASIGNLAITKIPACCNQACCCLSEIDRRLEIEYAYYLLKACKSFWIEKSKGGGQPNISQDIIKQTWLPLPPKTEQVRVAQYLSKCESYFLRTIETIQREINLIQEYSTRLISGVVTGKVDVRDIEIPEYEAVSDDVTEDKIINNFVLDEEDVETGVE